jgi:hypothetical protein
MPSHAIQNGLVNPRSEPDADEPERRSPAGQVIDRCAAATAAAAAPDASARDWVDTGNHAAPPTPRRDAYMRSSGSEASTTVAARWRRPHDARRTSHSPSGSATTIAAGGSAPRPRSCDATAATLAGSGSRSTALIASTGPRIQKRNRPRCTTRNGPTPRGSRTARFAARSRMPPWHPAHPRHRPRLTRRPDFAPIPAPPAAMPIAQRTPGSRRPGPARSRRSGGR